MTETIQPRPPETAVPLPYNINTILGGSPETEHVEPVTQAFLTGLEAFLFPKDEKLQALKEPIGFLEVKDAQQIFQLRPIWEQRAKQAQPLIVSIIAEKNGRAQEQRTSEFYQLKDKDKNQWAQDDPTADKLMVGYRTCVDRGVTHEAIAGFDASLGRSLAGDDEMAFRQAVDRFYIRPSSVKKKLIHWTKQDGNSLLGLVEHLGCGRRGQMVANLLAQNRVARLFIDVISNIDALTTEFIGKPDRIKKAVSRITRMWQQEDETTGVTHMVNDAGVWIGILTKIAQRQAYRYTKDVGNIIIPIELYDKRDGNLIVGLDNHRILTNTVVNNEGGFTDSAIDQLAQDGKIFSLKHHAVTYEPLLAEHSTVAKGSASFEDLQTNWLETRRKFVMVTQELWDLYHLADEVQATGQYKAFRQMVDRFVKLSFKEIEHYLNCSDNPDLVKRRHIHHLFQVIAYAWTLDTFEKGNPPGVKHIEDHLVGAEGSYGVKTHLSLAQGNIYRPTHQEILTGREVLLHSTPGEENMPIIYLAEMDTERSDDRPITGEELKIAQDDLRELMKLWPYLLVGDIIPIIPIIGPEHGGVSRLSLSSLMSFEDIIAFLETEPSSVPPFVPATNTEGRIVLVPGMEIVNAGLTTQGDLLQFREDLCKVADRYSDLATQRAFQSALTENGISS